MKLDVLVLLQECRKLFKDAMFSDLRSLRVEETTENLEPKLFNGIIRLYVLDTVLIHCI